MTYRTKMDERTMTIAEDAIEAFSDVLDKLSKDMREAAKTMNPQEARYMVQTYYQMQESRKIAHNQERALGEAAAPHRCIGWIGEQSYTLEKYCLSMLKVYADNSPIGQWAQSVVGIGPVIAAGLMAHIDIHKAPTAGHIWSYAGLTNETAWIGGDEAKKTINAIVDGRKRLEVGEVIALAHRLNCSPKWLARRVYRAATGDDVPFRGSSRETDEAYAAVVLNGVKITMKNVVDSISRRPWNADLKTLTWKIGQSFMKLSGNDKCVYGRLYAERKQAEIAANISGRFADQCSKREYGADTDARLWVTGCLTAKDATDYYIEPAESRMAFAKSRAGEKGSGVCMLPPAHIDARARRWVVKLFLAHWHGKQHEFVLGRPAPNPYPIAHLGHAHVIEPE